MIAGAVQTRSQTKAQTEQPSAPHTQVQHTVSAQPIATMATNQSTSNDGHNVASQPAIHPAFRGMPLPTCPNFDHDSPDPMNWLSHYELYALNYNVQEDRKLFQLPLFLDKEAKQWFSTLRPNEKDTWANFVRAFEARWDNTNSLEVFNKLSLLVQTPDQPVRQFITRFQHEARSLNLQDSQLLPMLYDKILPSLRPDILRKNPTSVAEFISAAVSAEQIVASSPAASGRATDQPGH